MKGARAISICNQAVVGWAILCLATELVAGDSALTIQKTGEVVRVGIMGEDGKEYSLEALGALLNQGKSWLPLASIAPDSKSKPVFVYDPTCTSKPQNFYRLRLLQGSN